MQKFVKRLPNSDTLCWRQNDLAIFFLMIIIFFSVAYLIIIYTYSPVLERCVTDWWILLMGIGYVCLFLFIICKKVE